MKTSKSLPITDPEPARRAWGILLDLDQTLVLTSRIAHLRNARRWSEAVRSLGDTSIPPGTRKFLTEALRMGPLGVVTSSPRSYAERLLEHHAIDVPVLVAYHDVSRRKPHPDPLLLAASKLGLPSERCVYVGDSDADIESAARAGAAPVGITWEGPPPSRDIRERASAWCANWAEVLEALEELGGPRGLS